MFHILVTDDDKNTRLLLKAVLESEGYTVYIAANGEEALTVMDQQHIDLVVLDIMMPKMDGYELCESIRSFEKELPIIFMTAKDDKVSKLTAYSIGVDDYVEKPFDMDILLMKISAVLRRSKISNDKSLTVGNLTMNNEEHSATVDGDELPLTVREFNLLFKLLQYPKKTFTRSALMEEFWDYDSSATSRTVDVYMAKLREKTKGCDGFEIQTVHGLGYKVILTQQGVTK